MPFLEICIGKTKEKRRFEIGKSIKQLLDATDARVRSACNGIGACGLCKIRVLSQEIFKPSQADEIHLDKEEIEKGVRLACQHYPSQDISIEVMAPAPKSQWHSDVISDYVCDFEIIKSEGCRLAIDIGTTHLGIAFVDSNGVFIADRTGVNPQAFAGADILSRIVSAVNDKESADSMWDMLISALAEGVKDITKREGMSHRKITSCDIVGNSAMIAMLCRHNYHLLLDPAYWMAPIETNISDENRAKIASNLKADSVTIWPPLAGFVGSDVVAGIVSVGLLKREKPSMLIDFGTNSEIALWDGKKLWLTSAAGGPAFEASGGGCSIPAGRGAIFRASKEKGEWRFETLGDSKPEGVCGSGLVDLIAELVAENEITPLGTFKDASLQLWRFPIKDKDIEFFLSKKDIDLFARAKAAISVGVVALCEAADVEISDIDALYIGGDFGKHLDIKNAMNIGLIPQIATHKVKTLGNTALLGCLDLALSKEARDEFWVVKKIGSVTNLASYQAFDDVYMQNLYLRAMSYGD